MNSPALPSTPRRHLIAPIPLRAAADLHSARTREFQNIPSPSPTSSKSKWSNRIGGAVRRASSMFKGTRTETAPSSSTPSNGPYPPGYVPYPYPGPIIPQGGQLQGGLFAPGFIPYPSLPPLPGHYDPGPVIPPSLSDSDEYNFPPVIPAGYGGPPVIQIPTSPSSSSASSSSSEYSRGRRRSRRSRRSISSRRTRSPSESISVIREGSIAERTSPGPLKVTNPDDDSIVDAVIHDSPGDGPPENLKGVILRLEDVFENINQYKRLLGSRDREAQQLLDTFQLLLDTPGLSAKFRRNLLVAMQRLSKRAGLYPTYYNLKGVELTSEHPVAAGSFADIYKGRHLGQTVCLKVVRLYQTSHVASFLQKFAAEAILWGQLSHPNLLPIFGLYQYTTRLCLISPWMENGDVISFLREHPQSNRLLLILDVASGIGYLHENHIVHGDLKGANILVSESGRACLADFGLSSVSDTNILHWTSNSSAGSKGGSVRWQAPELFDVETDDIVYNSMFSDVYAFACVAYEIFTGNVPFFEIPRDPAVMRKVQTGGTPSPPPASSLAWRSWGLTRPHWELMKVCWSGNPAGRPSIQRVMAHFASKKPHDERPVGNVNIVSREAFRDSVNAGLELPSVDDIKAILDDFSDSSAL